MTTPPAILPLVAIVGPTASGKSSLGIFLAKEFGGEVIACDSTQLYRGFDIGTAKPSPAERAAVPHHLLDILESTEDSTAGRYRERALVVLEQADDRGGDAVVSQQAPGPPRVFRGDGRDLAEGAQGAMRDVFQIADGCGDQEQGSSTPGVVRPRRRLRAHSRHR